SACHHKSVPGSQTTTQSLPSLLVGQYTSVVPKPVLVLAFAQILGTKPFGHSGLESRTALRWERLPARRSAARLLSAVHEGVNGQAAAPSPSGVAVTEDVGPF